MKTYLLAVTLILIDVVMGLVLMPMAISSNKWEVFCAGIVILIALPPINYLFYKKFFVKNEDKT